MRICGFPICLPIFLALFTFSISASPDYEKERQACEKKELQFLGGRLGPLTRYTNVFESFGSSTALPTACYQLQRFFKCAGGLAKVSASLPYMTRRDVQSFAAICTDSVFVSNFGCAREVYHGRRAQTNCTHAIAYKYADVKKTLKCITDIIEEECPGAEKGAAKAMQALRGYTFWSNWGRNKE